MVSELAEKADQISIPEVCVGCGVWGVGLGDEWGGTKKLKWSGIRSRSQEHESPD